MTMSFIYEQKIKGKVYLYKSTSYWDKKKKQPRQKRVYLGKKDEATGELIPTTRCSIPTGSWDVGSLHLLKKISKKLNLVQALKKIFPEDYEEILYLSFFKVIKKEPYYLYPLWCEDSYVSGENYLDSRSISKFLFTVGRNEEAIENFFLEWIKRNKSASQAVMFDITSISSYGSGNDFLGTVKIIV